MADLQVRVGSGRYPASQIQAPAPNGGGDLLFASDFGATSPYAFTGAWADDEGTYFTLSQQLNTGPSGRDFVRSTNIATGTHAQPYAGWKKTGLTAPTQGSTRYVRVRLRIGSGFDATGNSPETVWSTKWIIHGDQDGPGEDRIIVALSPRVTLNDCHIRVAKNIGDVPSDGAGDVNLTLGIWNDIQYEVRYSSTSTATDGWFKLWVNNDTYASPTASSATNIALPSASHTSLGLGFFHNATTAAGGSVQLDYCQMEYDDAFDSSFHANQ